jgi:hypothetical protein
MGITRLAVGIPTHQEADSIENVVKQVDQGLARLSDPADCIIVNVDSNSPDGTSEIFLRTPTRCRKESFVTTERPRGKGRNVLRFFERCIERQVAALAIVDGDLLSITPDWIEALLGPVLRREADYVTPLYFRHRFDGPMTNHFAYPIMCGYFGIGLRQPIGGEFGFSSGLVNYILRQPFGEVILGYGIDIFLSMSAVGGDFKLTQTMLGRKLHKPSLPKMHLIHEQSIAATIATMRLYPIHATDRHVESAPDSIDDLPTYGLYDESQTLLIEARAQARELKPVYRFWLGGESLALFAALEDGGTTLSAEAWTDLLAACIARAVWIEPQIPAHIISEALVPALFVRTVTCWNETWRRPISEFNAEVNLQARLLREKLLRRHQEVGNGLMPVQGVKPRSV